MKRILLRIVLGLASAFELLAGAVLCCFLSMCVPVIFLTGTLDLEQSGSTPAWERLVAGGLFAVTVVLGGYCVVLALGSMFGRDAWGPEAALRQPRWPALLRPFLAAYWGLHFLLGAGMAFGMERLGYQVPGDQPLREVIGLLLLMGVAVFGFTYAANFYLLLALTAVTRSPRVVYAVWRWRVLIDIALSAAAIMGGSIVRP